MGTGASAAVAAATAAMNEEEKRAIVQGFTPRTAEKVYTVLKPSSLPETILEAPTAEAADVGGAAELPEPKASAAGEVTTVQDGDNVNFLMKNNTDAHSTMFTITFGGCTNVEYPEGNPYIVTLGPGEEMNMLLCKRSDENARWTWKYRYRWKPCYVPQEDPPDAFTDAEFPADMSSIGQSQSCFCCPDSVDLWVRAPTLGAPGRAILFEDICPDDIRQGKLGDCWLMAAMSALASYPDALKDLFSSPEVSATGKYEVKLFDIEAMNWINITIDDIIPCNSSGIPVFAKPDGEELWALLLEKAFAKFCGSYGALSGGSPAFAFQALTGEARITRFQNMGDGNWRRSRINRSKQIERGARNPRNGWWNWKNDDLFDPDALWELLSSSAKSNHLKACMIAGDSNSAEEATGAGLVTRHLYSVLRAELVSLADGSEEKLIQLRNPWGGTKEWTGDWSDTSTKWEENPDVASAVGYEANADGTFWMSGTDWVSNFTSITVCPKNMASGDSQGEDVDDNDNDDGQDEEIQG